MAMSPINLFIKAKNRFREFSLFSKIIVIVFSVGLGWFVINKLVAKKTAPLQYQTIQATKGTLIVSTTSSGQFSTTNSAQVSSQISGEVSKIFVKNDQVVKAGDALVQVNLDPDGKQKYLQALASYQSAKNSLNSAKANLYSLQSKMHAANQKFINDAVARGLATGDPTYIQESSDWLAAEAGYIDQQKVIEAQQTSLNSVWYSLQASSPIIHSPIAGKVTGLSLQVGTIIPSSSTVQKVASIKTNINPMMTVNLTEIDVPKVKMGDKATITVDALSGKTFTGKVVSIDAIGTVSSGVTTYLAVIQLDENSPEIFSNMSSSASIITDIKNDVLLVPSSSIQTQNGQSQARVMKGKTVNQVNVEIGLSSGTQTEVVSGLSEGDVVITGTTSSTTNRSSSSQTQSPFNSLGRGGFGGGSGGARVRAD